VRVAWAPLSESDDHLAFDRGAAQYSCHESNAYPGISSCGSDDPGRPNGGDSCGSLGGPCQLPARGPCGLRHTVPTHLSDGLWTLQWAWFGGAFAYVVVFEVYISASSAFHLRLTHLRVLKSAS
jgi:hypothetical protein